MKLWCGCELPAPGGIFLRCGKPGHVETPVVIPMQVAQRPLRLPQRVIWGPRPRCTVCGDAQYGCPWCVPPSEPDPSFSLCADAAPDRTTDGFRSTPNAPTTHERTLQMSTSPTEGGTTTGSNPAGVASPTTPEQPGNSDRTELRSVSTDGNSRKYQGGGPCRKCGLEAPRFIPFDLDTPPYFECFLGTGCNARPNVVQAPTSYVKPEGQTAADPGNPVLEAADQFNQQQDVFAVPAVQRCTVVVDAGETAGADECGAIVGTDLRCALCAGQRCYQHCGGVDHFRGRLVSRGGTDHFDWKVVEIAAGRFMGQLWERMLPDGRPELRTTSTGLTAERAATDLAEQAKVYEQSWLKMPVPPRVPGYERPRPVGRIDDATDQLLKASKGKLSDQKRAELLLEVIEWLRASEEGWALMPFDHFDPNEQRLLDLWRLAKKLHDRQVVGLFSRLAGAL